MTNAEQGIQKAEVEFGRLEDIWVNPLTGPEYSPMPIAGMQGDLVKGDCCAVQACFVENSCGLVVTYRDRLRKFER